MLKAALNMPRMKILQNKGLEKGQSTPTQRGGH